MKNGKYAKKDAIAKDNVQKAMVLMKDLAKTKARILEMAKNKW